MNLVKRQICGAVGIVAVAVFFCAAMDIAQYTYSFKRPAAFCEYEKSGIVVELAGDECYGGIYFLPHGATVRDLLRKAGLGDITGFEDTDLTGMLNSGDRVVPDRTRYLVTRGFMNAPYRLAFGIPVDLNAVTQEELMLVPGIGLKTASKIIGLREEKGKFSGVDALKKVLKKERYSMIKEYLYVEGSSP